MALPLFPSSAPDSSRGVHLLGSCPMCRATFSHVQTQVMAERDEAHLLFLECARCGSAMLAIIRLDVNGPQTIGALTDLTRSEVPAMPEQAVTIDHALEFHRWLAEPMATPLPLIS